MNLRSAHTLSLLALLFAVSSGSLAFAQSPLVSPAELTEGTEEDITDVEVIGETPTAEVITLQKEEANPEEVIGDLPWLKAAEPAAPVKVEEKKEDEQLLKIEFGINQIDVPPSSVDKVDNIIKKMRDNKEMRVELRSYSSKRKGLPGEARRVSLKRALSLRKYLLSRGIEQTRIIVKALGEKSEGGAENRIDIFKL